jgi:hypothetical protein
VDVLRVSGGDASIGLLIIDQNFGVKVTGYVLAGTIREQRPIVPLVLLSPPPHSGQVLNLGPNDRLLTRPFRADNLLRLLRETFVEPCDVDTHVAHSDGCG